MFSGFRKQGSLEGVCAYLVFSVQGLGSGVFGVQKARVSRGRLRIPSVGHESADECEAFTEIESALEKAKCAKGSGEGHKGRKICYARSVPPPGLSV